MIAQLEPLIYDISKPGRKAYSLPDLDVPVTESLDPALSRDPEMIGLPEVSELDVVRHFTHLSRLNHAIDVGFYPLGSCTMKYNPKLNEDMARLSGLSDIHPLQDPSTVQGALQIQYELQAMLAEIAGFDAVTLQPAAGAQGELVGVQTIRAYHLAHGGEGRTKILVPDAAHGTNPATAAMCGYQVVTIRSDKRGNVDLEHLRELAGPDTAALMLTNPNTLGLFDEHLLEIGEIVHKAGGLMYGDGANFNAILGVVRPGDVGFDVMHINLHKTFSTPHGGGGPGSGPVGVKALLAPYLPTPIIDKEERDGQPFYYFRELPDSIGKVRSFWGNFGMHVRAYTYIRVHGAEGLRQISQNAVLNANYILNELKDVYEVAYDRLCMHEFVLTGRKLKQETGVRTLDVAKRLLDFGYHSPTIYFPLIVEEALMIEPTETESKTTLDEFIGVMRQIVEEAHEKPDFVKNAPYNTPLLRLDETTAARKPQTRFRCF